AGKFQAVLEEAYLLNIEDPSLARFVGAVRADVRRHDEVAEHLAGNARNRDNFFLRLVDTGISTGEVDPSDRQRLIEFVRLVLVGMVEGPSESPAQQRTAIDAIGALFAGKLIRPVDRATPE
ncbi:MAG: hypothetical protein AAFP84_08045, partial [Actinomycetota bacterium]